MLQPQRIIQSALRVRRNQHHSPRASRIARALILPQRALRARTSEERKRDDALSDMSELAISSAPTRQAIEAKDRSAPLKVTGRLRAAIEAMVWQGARRPQAAEIGGMTDHSLRSALNKPHVKAFYLSQLEVLRTSERARNIHTLIEVRDQTKNAMARVQAVDRLEQSAETQGRSTGSLSLPGLTIQIINTSGDTNVNASLTRSDAKPLIEQGDGSHDGGD